MLICSFFSSDLYRRFAERLKSSCDSLGLKSEVRPRTAKASWGETCQEKPKFILEMLDEFPRHNVAWVDSDAEVKLAPWMFFAPDFDIAARVEREIAYGGTLFFRQSPASRAFLQDWMKENSESAGQDDRPGFFRALEKSRTFFRSLPPSYDWCRRFDVGEAVIEQHMISRLCPEERERMLS